MKTLLLAGATVALLTAVNFAPAMAGTKALHRKHSGRDLPARRQHPADISHSQDNV